jgi:hypothetical protein
VNGVIEDGELRLIHERSLVIGRLGSVQQVAYACGCGEGFCLYGLLSCRRQNQAKWLLCSLSCNSFIFKFRHIQPWGRRLSM